MVVSPSFDQSRTQLRDCFANSLASFLVFLSALIHIARRFHIVHGPLDFAETTRPSERRREQPEESTDLRIVAQINAFAGAPRDARVVFIAEDIQLKRGDNISMVKLEQVSAGGALIAALRTEQPVSFERP